MNCLIVDDDPVTCSVLETLVRNSGTLNFIGACRSAGEAATFLKKKPADLLFLDVEMPGMNGLDFLGKIAEHRPEVILVTAHKKYAADAFESDVTDFLVKPVSTDRFRKAVEKAQRMHAMKSQAENEQASLLIKTSGGYVKMFCSDILFIKSLADYVSIHTAENKFIVHSTLKGILARLPQEKFIRVHHSYIVNIDHMSASENNFIQAGRFTIPVSRSKKKNLRVKLKSMIA